MVVLFAATCFGSSPRRFTRERCFRVAPVRTTLAFVRLEKPITPRAFLWSSSSSRCFVGSIPPRAFRLSGAATFLNPREGTERPSTRSS